MKKSLGVVLIVLLLACSKDPEEAVPPGIPKIEIIYPKDGEVYTSGQQFCLKAVITDRNQLEKINLKIEKVSDNSVFKNDEYFTPDRTYILESKFPVDAAMSGNFKMILEARNLNGRITKTVLDFSAN